MGACCAPQIRVQLVCDDFFYAMVECTRCLCTRKVGGGLPSQRSAYGWVSLLLTCQQIVTHLYLKPGFTADMPFALPACQVTFGRPAVSYQPSFSIRRGHGHVDSSSINESWSFNYSCQLDILCCSSGTDVWRQIYACARWFTQCFGHLYGFLC